VCVCVCVCVFVHMKALFFSPLCPYDSLSLSCAFQEITGSLSPPPRCISSTPSPPPQLPNPPTHTHTHVHASGVWDSSRRVSVSIKDLNAGFRCVLSRTLRDSGSSPYKDQTQTSRISCVCICAYVCVPELRNASV